MVGMEMRDEDQVERLEAEPGIDDPARDAEAAIDDDACVPPSSSSDDVGDGPPGLIAGPPLLPSSTSRSLKTSRPRAFRGNPTSSSKIASCAKGSRRSYIEQFEQPVEIMSTRQIRSSEARTHFFQLLDDVERGETIVITRHGRPIARLTPEIDSRREDIRKAIEAMRALRASLPKSGITTDDLLQMRHEDHKY